MNLGKVIPYSWALAPNFILYIWKSFLKYLNLKSLGKLHKYKGKLDGLLSISLKKLVR